MQHQYATEFLQNYLQMGEINMFLKSLEIRGFKSFADKTELAFKRGITAVVGPNGSGKSNISDAVKWVLGEQSVKNLRGGKMQDVIFAGTEYRKPVGLAQVTLVLDNSDGQLPIEYTDVTIMRRLLDQEKVNII